MRWVFQSYALYPHMDVFNNLAFGLHVATALPARRSSGASRPFTVQLGLDPYLKAQAARAVEVEQRQRVALGRTIVREPKAVPV